jgi:hypothetical protein
MTTTDGPPDHDELRAKLADVDGEIERIRSEHAGLIQQVGGSSFGAQDAADTAAAAFVAPRAGVAHKGG